jgi:CelD/BcsL family acetyltransferase involved in cellulose biosynthesis
MRYLTLAFMVSAGMTAWAQTPSLVLTSEVEDGKKMLIATLTQDGKPLEGVPISFYVDRMFGRLLVGEDKTMEDGSAAVPAPEGMASGPGGELVVTAQATLPDAAPVEAQASTEAAAPSTPAEPVASPAATPSRVIDAQFTLKGEAKFLQEQEFVPRALWAPRAPVALLATITAILVVVWGSYVFVVSQIIKIKLGAKV